VALLLLATGIATHGASLATHSFGGVSGPGDIRDLAQAHDGSVLACGLVAGPEDLPKGVTPILPLGGTVGPESAFVANFAADLSAVRWVAVLPSRALLPTRLTQARGGEIYLGGKTGNPGAVQALPQFRSTLKDGKWSGHGVVLRLSADGQKADWLVKAGPNVENVSGLAMDRDDHLLLTGDTAVKGSAMYVLRLGKDGQGLGFAKAKRGAGGGREPDWALYLNEQNADLRDTYYAFYRQGGKEGFDLDGEGQGWGKVQFWQVAPRVGGQVCMLPDGDFAVSAGLYFMFKEGGKKSFPAFNTLLARFSPDGELRWATNLYQDGDSVHTPDQKPRDLACDAKGENLYLLISQHGSNVYRLKGELRGDTGNMKICWAGKVAAKDGTLLAGWYFMNNRHREKDGKGGYEVNGLPRSAPHPKLAGNELNRIRAGADGNVYLAGAASARAWTSPDAFQAWPEALDGGGFPCLLVLDGDLRGYRYASLFTGETTGQGVGGAFNGLILSGNDILLGGVIAGGTFQRGPAVPWRGPDAPSPAKKAALVQVKGLEPGRP